MDNSSNTVKGLALNVTRWKYLYYNGTPEVSDAVYDEAEANLERLDPNNAALKVGMPLADGEKHPFPMRSIQKALTPPELLTWFRNTCKGEEVVLSHKIDGLAVELIYKNGILFKAVTRGDGEKGEDVTKNVLFIKEIPTSIHTTYALTIVRGEIYMKKSVFNKVREEGHTDPRNLAVGSLKCDDVKVTASRQLSFFAYKLCSNEYFPIVDYGKELRVLEAMGFTVVPYTHANSFEFVTQWFAELEKMRDSLDYKIDGMVVHIANNAINEGMGFTDHHPRYAMCLKFEAEQAVTVVRKIDWSMSRNGTLTPVAVFDPVKLAGASIKCAKAHNINFLDENNIYIGGDITIVRSGDVIPKIIAGHPKTDKDIFRVAIPSVCPYCGAKAEVIKEVNTKNLKCTNKDCYKRVALQLEHYCKEVGIKGIGGANLEALVKQGLTMLWQLYQPVMLAKIDSAALRKTMNEQINKTYGIGFIDFLSGMGIPDFTRSSITKWVQSDNTVTFDTMKEFPTESVRRVVGEVAYNNIKKFYTPEFMQYVLYLMNIVKPVFIADPKPPAKESPITGKKICLTGTLSEARPTVAKFLESYGAIIVDSVSKTTDYLVCGDKAGSKKEKAEKAGVKTLTEIEVRRMVQ